MGVSVLSRLNVYNTIAVAIVILIAVAAPCVVHWSYITTRIPLILVMNLILISLGLTKDTLSLAVVSEQLYVGSIILLWENGGKNAGNNCNYKG